MKISFELKGASLAPGEGNENDNQDIVGKTDNQLAIIIILAAITVVLVVFIILRKRLARKIENVGEVAENSTKGKIYLTNEEKPRGGNRKYLEAIMLLEEDYEASFLDEEVYVELREKYIDIYKKESFRK